jgi:hypothetical protein
MKMAISKLARVFLLVTLIFGVFGLFNTVQVVAARGPEEKLSLERCPSENEEEFNKFFFASNGLRTEAIGVSRFVMSYEEAAQRYLELETLLRDVPFPDCAQALYDALDTSFSNEAKAYAALAEDNILSHLKYWYYHSASVEGLHLVPFIIRLIQPIHPLPGQYLNHT